MLKSGAHITVVPVASPAFSPQQTRRGVRLLESMGYRVTVHPNCFEREGYLAGSDQARAEALAAAYLDEQVDAVWAVQGGFGCARMLEHLPFAAMRQADGKPVLGFSDVTALHLALLREVPKAIPCYAPVVGTLARATDITKTALSALLADETYEVAKGPDTDVWSTGQGTVTSPLTGGCLMLLAASLGTPYEIQTEGHVLFFEDVDEEPYRIDGYLTQLRLAGKLQGVRAVLVGDLTNCRPRNAFVEVGSLALDVVLEHHLRPLGVPVVTGLAIGHGQHQVALPYGRSARVDDSSVTILAPSPGAVR